MNSMPAKESQKQSKQPGLGRVPNWPIYLLLAAGWLSGWCVGPGVGLGLGRGDDEPQANVEDADETASNEIPPADEGDGEGGIGFPSDRLRERQLDRGRRLVADQRWSDAAMLFDEILAADRDVFTRSDRRQRTWQSIKAETNRLIGGLEKAGREAYELQFRARADRMLEQAVAANDTAGIVAVARRWFHTPAGYRATLLAAIEALEANQPLAAAVWLDRLSAVDGGTPFEPTLSIMRSIAWLRAGDRVAAAAILERLRNGGGNVARIAGKDVTVSFPAGGGLEWLTGLVGERQGSVKGSPKGQTGGQSGDWVVHRGDPARNAVATASCPLLAARYRVPLARHPEESRLLESRRRLHADQDLPVLPAGTPLAVEGTILTHTPMGLLAVDFETGKRVWLQPGGPSAPLHAGTAGGEGGGDGGDADVSNSFSSVFDDVTSGMLASDGRLVFAVESHPDAVSSRQVGPLNFRPAMQSIGGGWRGGNTLSAYDLASRGSLRWRLPQAGEAADEVGKAAAGTAWYLGAPLPVGEQLLALVEEKGEIRLDVLAADTGRAVWSQPLAEIDEERSIDNRDSHARRLAGLSPSVAEGVLVCPTGAGAIVAVDLATRTLLWAYEYPQALQGGVVVLPNGFRVPRGQPMGGGFGGDAVGDREQRMGRWLDSVPILAVGRVLLTPGDSQELHCLDLRQGTVVWRLPRKDRLYVAGIVDGRAIVVGRRGVEAIDLTNGRVLWQRPLAADHGSPSGRSILTGNRLLLPLDTPEVLAIDLADGQIAGRSAARGNAVPGNLLAYRGEVISQGADSLDVFHQMAALESRIETAFKANPQDPWARLWKGQLDLDRGNVATGIASVRAAHALQPNRVTADVVAKALLFALRRDFAQAAPFWREAVSQPGAQAGAPTTILLLRTVVDGFLQTGDLPQAWEALQQLLAVTAPSVGSTGMVLEDGLNKMSADIPAADETPVSDGADARLTMLPARWIQGRLADLMEKAAPPLRTELEAYAVREATAAAATAAADRMPRLRQFIERFGRHELALLARRQLADLLDARIEAGGSGEETRGLVLERDFLLLDLAHVGRPEDRQQAAAVLAGIRSGFGVAAAADFTADAWPMGRVVQRRGAVARAGGPRQGELDDLRFVRSRLLNIPVAVSADSFLPGLELAFDQHQQSGIIATDGFGRPIGDPFGLKSRSDVAQLMPILQSGSLEEASVVGRVVFVRAGATIAAFEMTGGGPGQGGRGKNRPLWMLADKSDVGSEPRAGGFGVAIGAGRLARQGNIAPGMALGARVSEPRHQDDASRRGGATGGIARRSGIPVMIDRSLKVYDPLSGRLLWERQRLPQVGDLIGDNDYLCVCPADGRQAIVLAMADGRLVRTLDLPGSERRLLTSGRRMLVVQSTDEGSDQTASGGRAWARRVRIDLIDPVDGQRLPLGEYPGDSRAAAAGDGSLAVVEPSGDLTLLDLDAGRVKFRTRLPDMPVGLEQVQLMPWMDRYLVLVGRAETPDEQQQLERIGSIGPLPGMSGREMPQLVTGSLWAVDRSSGDMLWPVPATILRHSLHGQTGGQLPVLLFARSIQAAREPDRPRLSVLCLDKRTGQAVYVDDRFNGRAALRPDIISLGCSISGDPAAHTISLSQGRRDAPELQLEFTGGPTAPRPPFQAAAARSSTPVDPLVEIEYWMRKALTIPLPF